MQLEFDYDLKPKVWGECGGYTFCYCIQSCDFKEREKKKLEECAQNDWSTTTKGGHKV